MNKLCVFLLSLFLCNSSAFSLVLEELAKEKLDKFFSNRKIGFYIGSFDPIHKGHEQVVSDVLSKKLVDYCLIFPAWGGDKYKNRTDVRIRREMLFSLYKNSSNVIVTNLSPIELQKLLTIDSSESILGKPSVQSAINQVRYIVILGSDTALEISAEKARLATFMRGIKIPEKYYQNTIGGIIALPVEEFVVSLREGSDIKSLNNMIGDRPIIAVLLSENNKGVSSTKVRNKLKNNEDVSNMLSQQVIDIIEKNNLYNSPCLNEFS